jgi:deazaflavin-dependent oxidoreductase (nitroreductase family)
MSATGQVLRLHERLYEASDGRIGHKMIGVPTLLMRSTGARSGKTRTNALVYARDGADYLVVASNGGADKDPAWLFNLRADPAVEVQIGRERLKAVARILGPEDADYGRLWKIVDEANHERYGAYQEQTERPIPIVAITPS